MASPILQIVTHYARDPKVVAGAGVLIMSTMKIWEDITNYPDEEPVDENKIDLDWLDVSDEYKRKALECYKEYKACDKTE